ncbi:MAG: RibD family protein [Hyphomicrobiaceae bacterium]
MDSQSLPPDYASSLHAVRDADPARPFVVAQLGQSLDGRIALPSGESRWINNEAALTHVHRLRAVVDAVVVGAGTVAADDPQLNVRRVDGRNPARVVIDPTCRISPAARMLEDDGVARIVICQAKIAGERPARLPSGVEVLTIDAEGAASIDPGRIIAALHARGLRRLLIEGGATTVSAFVAAGLVDRLHMLVAPVLLGSGKSGLSFGPLASLSEAPRPVTDVHVLPDGDVLFDLHLKASIGEP